MKMNVYHKTLIAVGVVLVLLPFLGIPYVWKVWSAFGLGAVVLLVMFFVRARHASTNEDPLRPVDQQHEGGEVVAGTQV